MKRFFILASAAIVALASCAKTQVVYNDAPEEIAFKQITNVMTKADPSPAAAATLEGNSSMGVFANLTKDNNTYFANIEFEDNVDTDSYWYGKPAQYWPLEGSLNFAFYAPYKEGIQGPRMVTVNEATSFSNTLIIPVNNSGNQTNWLYSDMVYTGSKATATVIAPTMNHLLAKITVKVTGSSAVKLTELILTGTEQNETATITYSETKSEVSWTNTGATVNRNLMAQNDDPIGSDFSLSTSSELTMTCYVIPSNQTSFIVQYKINDASAPDYTHSLGDAKWEAGKHYIYNVTINPQQIKFNPSVQEWGQGNSTPVEGSTPIHGQTVTIQ